MIYYHYGNLKNATITAGDVTAKLQYPMANINYLNKNLYTEIDDNDTSASAIDHKIVLAKIDFGAVQSGITSCALDLSSFAISLDGITYNISAVRIAVYGSTDDITYAKVDSLWDAGKVEASAYSTTLTDIYTETFDTRTYRYWEIVLEVVHDFPNTLDWDIDGKINNLYIGDYIELPSPAFVPYGFTHKVKSSEAFGGSQFGIDTQGQRKTWAFKYGGLDNDDKTNIESFDLVNKGGSVPCYIESLEGSTQIIDPHFARVYGGETLQQIAYRVYEMTNNIEEEL